MNHVPLPNPNPRPFQFKSLNLNRNAAWLNKPTPSLTLRREEVTGSVESPITNTLKDLISPSLARRAMEMRGIGKSLDPGRTGNESDGGAPIMHLEGGSRELKEWILPRVLEFSWSVLPKEMMAY